MDPKDKRKDVGTPKYTSKEPKVIVGKNCLDRENSKPRKMEVSSGDVEGHEPSRHVPLARCATMYLRRDAPPCASGETRRYAGIVTLTALLSSSFIPGSINPDSPSIVIILIASVRRQIPKLLLWQHNWCLRQVLLSYYHSASSR
ncbi:hypothetical protein F2Q69_00036500 [Brassica cretica]|uniref:Uncharacterized protein n=1 Tax=Brassica cretica TaxID=69181 RepID=A0A8S9ST61_BRACR|nr:hypothetical protein F2Q69_00036500 [Brassica cretica]